MNAPLLTVRDLKVAYRTSAGEAFAVDGVSFNLAPGEFLGIVGESGCGKSTMAKAVLGLLPTNARIAAGSVQLRGQELVGLSTRAWRRLRWKEIALVPQSAMNGFDPVYTVEAQLDEAMAAHSSAGPAARRERMGEMFDLVGIDRRRLSDYPHQFSGGMRQRAMIAMAMVLDPQLVVADEPTTGLDVIVQDQIIQRIRRIQREQHKTMLLITHDMALVAENCDRIVVMYAGQVMEAGREAVFRTPFHPYTLGLCNAFPDLDDRDRELIAIPGVPPNLVSPPPGCRFAPRCPFATDVCRRKAPPLVSVGPDHQAACHHVTRVADMRERARLPATWREPAIA
ncbi:ABC transporter ATP-binding protein [Verticiella sediminum]|uniref:ABC transporter ATP-binding protein n=1 Tax=Verticiella sediminum TaxID=1247510 RepID=A0A556B198_9BURK|nr:ABC transporter ATP-binding protein [Verticiella sediminum]TSH98924.1 ABC transporter ATP-binding protein [Verticiella sediminum]